MKSDSGKVLKFPDHQKIQEEAAVWVARCDTRELVGTHRDELNKWLSENPAHIEEFKSLSGLWGDFDILDELNYVEGGREVHKIKQLKTLRGFRVLVAIAATVILSLGVLFYYQPEFIGDPTQNAVFQTTLGGQEQVTLVDGSVMIINTDSEVEVNITEEFRDIRLMRGEVHFDVAHDPGRPFSVYAGTGIARAVGTAFTVQLRDSAMEVIVSEGRVALLSQQKPEKTINEGIIEKIRKAPLIEISVGDNAVVTEEKVELLAPLSDAELTRKLSWRRGVLAFAGEPLSEVVREVSRYTVFVIEIDDPQLKALPIGGYFKVGEVEEFLEALKGTFKVDVERLGKDHVRLSYRS